MRKIISAVLVLSMLAGICLPVSATENREEFLNNKNFRYVPLESYANADLFAKWEDVCNYGRFNKSADGSISVNFAKVTYSGGEIFNWLPMTTNEGDDIKGTEAFYSKGFKKTTQTTSVAGNVYLIEDLLGENGATVSGYRYGATASNSAADAYDKKISRETKPVTRTVNNGHIVEKTGNYVYAENNGIKHKIGPVSETEVSPNAVFLSDDKVTVDIADKADYLSLLLATNDVNTHNTTTSSTGVGAIPEAVVLPVVINYANGDVETKYTLIADVKRNTSVLDGNLIVYAEKKTDGTDWTAADFYGASKKTFKYLNSANKEEHQVDFGTFTANDITFKNPDVIMPETAKVAQVVSARQDACRNAYGNKASVANFDLGGREVTSVTLEKNYKYNNMNIPTSIVISNSTTDARAAIIPVNIPKASDKYDYFAYVGGNCNNAMLLSATLFDVSLQEKIDVLEAEIAKLSDTYVPAEGTKIYEIKQKMEALNEEGVISSDYDATLYAKFEFLYEQYEIYALQSEIITELTEILDNLPESYSRETGMAVAEAKSIIGKLLKIGITENYIKALSDNYERYESHLAVYNEWLNVKNSQDRMVINWTAKDDMHAADIFEFSTAKLEEIPNKQGIVMNSVNDVYPTTYKHGSFIGFYSTDSAKTKNPDTFPDKYNQYYIKNNNITYGYSGISETIGENTYNAGMIAPSYGFEIPFDSVTKYDTISILANGITFLSNEYARQLQAIKTKVSFADGTSKEEISLVGNFAYTYRMALYSMLDGDALPYSELLSERIKRNLDELWYPKEANVSSYFKLAPDSIRLYYNADQVTKEIKKDSTLGRATAINIDAEGKAVEKVSVSYATASDLQKMGGVAYDKYIRQETNDGVTTDIERENKNTYYIPIDKSQLAGVTGYEENRDYYMSVIINPLYPVYLHGVTGVRTESSSYAEDIAEIENIIKGLSEEFNIADVKDMKDAESRIAFLENQGVSKASFDSALLEKLENLLESNVAENGHYEIYVSPDGDDSGYGYYGSPVKTLERAKAIARTYKNARPVDIILLEGEHNLSKTLELTAFDSGTKENPVTIKGMGGVITTADTLSYYDFEKVTEQEAGERLQPKVIGKVLKVNLADHGIYAGDMPMFYSTLIGGDGFEDVTFFVNDKEQSVAQYPNGESNYETWVDLADTSINSGKIKVNANRAKKWQGEKFAYFEGYPSPDYSNERNNITIEGDLICFKNKARFDLDESHSRRYKVKHMLYELDSPGEWYIDRDTNILYYYPTADFNEGSKIQIATRKLDAITTTTGLSNFYLDGVKFDKIRGNAFVAGASQDNVNIYNCQFTNISNIAVKYTAKTNSSTLANIANYTDAAKNCEIRNNRFINIGSSAINFIGGNRSTLSEGNNVIANNYIYNASDKQKCNPAVYITGAKNYVLNNEIHMGTFHAINHSGNENVIAYNELYNMLRDTGDCGVIYNGRQLATRGTEIAYNYIHDYKHLDERTKDNCVGVYLDDRLSGINIHHNIIFGNGVGEDANGIQNGGGQHNKINYNTIVDADETMTRTNRLIADYLNNADCTAFDELIRISGMASEGEEVLLLLDLGNTKKYKMLAKNEFYFERYPEMYDSIETLINPNETVPQFVNKYPFILTLPEFSEGGRYGNLSQDIANGNDLTKYRLLSLKSTIGNEYIGNIANRPWRASESKDIDGNIYDVYEKFGSTNTDNVDNATEDTFVNYAGRDFRIKGETGGGALDESFDLNKIGIQADGSVFYDLDFELNSINTVNPKAGLDRNFEIICVDGSDKSNVYLEWERVAPADYYTVEIATDENMSNIIYRNENAYFTRLNVDLSDYSQNEFYFRVTARNIGRNGNSWTNSDGVRKIKTLYSVSVDIYEDAAVPFDISADFNVDVFNNEGETHNSSSKLGGKSETLGMYNLTNLKKLVPANGYYEYGGAAFCFPQVGYDTSKNNAVSTQVCYDNLSFWDTLSGKKGNYTYTLKTEEQGYYDKVKLAMSSKLAAKDYEIIAHYTDNSSETHKVALHQYYSTAHSYETANIILTVDGVNYQGQKVSSVTPYTMNKIYEAVIDTDNTKVLKSIEFVRTSGTVYSGGTNDEYIFAITGVQSERILENGNKMQAISMKNYSGAEENANVIITGYIDGEYTVIMVPATIRNNKYAGVLNIEIPEKAERMTSRAMFLWERDPNTMKPYTTKLPIKEREKL